MNGYDSYLKSHIAEFGKTPKIILIGYTYENLNLWDTSDCVKKIPKIFASESSMAIYNKKTGVFYETKETFCGHELYQILDSKAYEKYHAPMPYWIYCTG